MSSGSGDGEAKSEHDSEVEVLMLCLHLHGVEGFDSTRKRSKWRLHESRKALCTRETNSLAGSTMKERNVVVLQDSRY